MKSRQKVRIDQINFFQWIISTDCAESLDGLAHLKMHILYMCLKLWHITPGEIYMEKPLAA